MIKTRFFLDTRRADKEGLFTLYLVLSKKGMTAMTTMGLKLSKDQWQNGEVVDHPKKNFWNGVLSAKNVYLQRKRVRFFSEKGSGPQDGSKVIKKFKDHCL